MSNLCVFFVLHLYIFYLSLKTKNTINDASIYLDLFKDLNKTNNILKNEFILSLFFTDTKSKKILLGNNNIGMSIDNKIDNRFSIEDKKITTLIKTHYIVYMENAVDNLLDKIRHNSVYLTNKHINNHLYY